MSQLNLVKDDQPWYSEGLNFQCTQCGQCCTGAPGVTWVSEKEIAEIALFLNLTIESFSKKYLRKVDGRMALLEDIGNYDCVFLKDKKCRIYSVRPKQCRTFPWWPRHLRSREDWEKAAEFCEGISIKHPQVPYQTIREQLAVQEET